MPVIPVEQWVVYQATLEAYTKAAGVEQWPELAEALRTQCGYDMRHQQREYRPETLEKVINVLVEYCYPGRLRAAAYEEFGRLIFRAYQATLVGRVVMAPVGISGVVRVVKIFSQAIKTATNFTTYEVVEINDRALLFQARNSLTPPAMVAGMLREMITQSNHPEVRISIRSGPVAHQYDLYITW
jgi:uncharacterized protein (TIGR02265 family)